jgi:YhcH/YjgK/YiaL family protein
MILDTHDNLHKYAGLFRGVDPQPLLQWLKACRDVSPGEKVEFAGERLFAKTLRQDTGAREALRWETHREYVDLQYVVGGGEIIEWAPAAKLTAESAYDGQTDLQFYAPAAADESLFMSEGLFVFVFPSDGHKPMVADGCNRQVHKVVAKIHTSLLII